eukprot:SAG31_NODE_3761_length_3906_cov_4.295246_1_plen_59_part_00
MITMILISGGLLAHAGAELASAAAYGSVVTRACDVSPFVVRTTAACSIMQCHASAITD